MFAGMFIGPTSQSPRIDEARNDSLYELEVAFKAASAAASSTGEIPPWIVDRLYRNLFIDSSGNTHRAEFCIDKLYSPDGPRGRLGLLELRGFEMPPHHQMAMVQSLLVRSLVALFWDWRWMGGELSARSDLHKEVLLNGYGNPLVSPSESYLLWLCSWGEAASLRTTHLLITVQTHSDEPFLPPAAGFSAAAADHDHRPVAAPPVTPAPK
jgi:hypothetical protein